MPARLEGSERLEEMLNLLKHMAIDIDRNGGGIHKGVLRTEKPDGTTFFFISFSMLAISIWVTLEGQHIKMMDDAIAENFATLTTYIPAYKESQRDYKDIDRAFREQLNNAKASMVSQLVENGWDRGKALDHAYAWFDEQYEASTPAIDAALVKMKQTAELVSPGLPSGVHIVQAMKNIGVNVQF